MKDLKIYHWLLIGVIAYLVYRWWTKRVNGMAPVPGMATNPISSDPRTLPIGPSVPIETETEQPTRGEVLLQHSLMSSIDTNVGTVYTPIKSTLSY